MTPSNLTTFADRLAEIRTIAEVAEFAAVSGTPMALLIARLARVVEAEMIANDASVLL